MPHSNDTRDEQNTKQHPIMIKHYLTTTVYTVRIWEQVDTDQHWRLSRSAIWTVINRAFRTQRDLFVSCGPMLGAGGIPNSRYRPVQN